VALYCFDPLIILVNPMNGPEVVAHEHRPIRRSLIFLELVHFRFPHLDEHGTTLAQQTLDPLPDLQPEPPLGHRMRDDL
jgi:hypothetical protein